MPLECGIIFDGIPEGAIPRKVGLIWGIPAEMTTGSTYKVVELVGTSSEGIDQAIEGAIARAGQTLKGLDWFEVKEIRGQIQGRQGGVVPSKARYWLPCPRPC